MKDSHLTPYIICCLLWGFSGSVSHYNPFFQKLLILRVLLGFMEQVKIEFVMSVHSKFYHESGFAEKTHRTINLFPQENIDWKSSRKYPTWRPELTVSRSDFMETGSKIDLRSIHTIPHTTKVSSTVSTIIRL